MINPERTKIMYKGRRDPEIQIIVSPDACSIYKDKQGKRWIEISVPHESIADYDQKFGTFMVEPSQVDVICNPNPMNVIRVNDDANILVSIKDSKHQLVSCEYLTPIGIIARWLKYYRHEIYSNIPNQNINLDTASVNLYKDYYYSGLRLEVYMTRLPYNLPDYDKEFRTMYDPYQTIVDTSPDTNVIVTDDVTVIHDSPKTHQDGTEDTLT